MTRPVSLWELNGRFCRLTRPKLDGGGTHDGVHLPDGRVLHITAARGLEVCSYGDFAQDREVRLKTTLDPRENPAAWQRVRQVLQENGPYHPAAHNCETVAGCHGRTLRQPTGVRLGRAGGRRRGARGDGPIAA